MEKTISVRKQRRRHGAQHFEIIYFFTQSSKKRSLRSELKKEREKSMQCEYEALNHLCRHCGLLDPFVDPDFQRLIALPKTRSNGINDLLRYRPCLKRSTQQDLNWCNFVSEIMKISRTDQKINTFNEEK